MTTSLTCWVEPRSTCHHWLSWNSELQRVVVFPSTALPGGKLAFSWLDDVAVWPCARSASADCGRANKTHAAASATSAASMRGRERASPWGRPPVGWAARSEEHTSELQSHV